MIGFFLGFRDFSDHSILIFSVVSGPIAKKNVFCRELMYLDSSFSGIYSIRSELGEIVSRKKCTDYDKIGLLNCTISITNSFTPNLRLVVRLSMARDGVLGQLEKVSIR